MATPEEKLIAAVSPLCAGRLFPDFAPLGTARPYVTWQQVGGSVAQSLSGGSTHSVRYQIEVWSDSRLASMALIRQIEAALVAPAVRGVPQGAAIATIDDANLRGAMQDFSIPMME